MKKVIFLTVCVFALSLQKGGTTMESDTPPISSGSTHFLTKKQIKELSIEGENGNQDSAFRLYLYYLLSIYDEKKSLYWLEISAKGGHPTAQYNMAHIMKEKNRISDAMYWAEMAKKNGVERADDLINEIKKKQAQTPSLP